MPIPSLPEHRIGIFVRFASSISAAAPETASRKRMPQCLDCGTEEAELRWRLWADAAAKKPLRQEHHREARRAVLVSACWQRHGKAPSGSPQSCAGERMMAAPWQSTIGKQQSTIGEPHGTIGKLQSAIGKPHGTIGKQENTYAVRRMSRPLMPM